MATSTLIYNSIASTTGQMIGDSFPMLYFIIGLAFIIFALGLIYKGAISIFKGR